MTTMENAETKTKMTTTKNEETKTNIQVRNR